MKVLVIGGSGFIGSNVVNTLLGDNYEVDIYDTKQPSGCGLKQHDQIDQYSDYPVYSCENGNGVIKNLAFVQGDICDIGRIIQLVKYDFVFHTAGLLGVSALFHKIPEAERVNVLGLLYCLEALRKTSIPMIQVGMVETWSNPYMITKQSAENWGFFYDENLNVSFTSLRFGHVYGPGQSTNQGKAVPTFILQALKNQPLSIYGKGDSVMNMRHVRDCASIITRSIEHPEVLGKRWDFHNPNQSLTVLELAELIIEISRSRSGIAYLPMRQGQQGKVKADYDSESIKKYPYGKPDIPLVEGLKETIEWYKGQL